MAEDWHRCVDRIAELEAENTALASRVEALTLRLNVAGEMARALDQIEGIRFSSNSRDYLTCPGIASKALQAWKETT